MLTYTEFSGTPYHIGLALGKFGAAAMHDTVQSSPLWEDVMQWRASEQLQAMQHQVQQHHPYIWDELQGLARGLELPADDVFLWNCRADLSPLATHESTTIMTLCAQGPRIIHMETREPGLTGHGAIAEFAVDHGSGFATFVRPGSIPGQPFFVTDKGLAVAVNTVPSDSATAGIPGFVLTRALLGAPDLSSAIQLLNDSTRSASLHLAMMQRGGSALLSIELNASELSVQPVKALALHTHHFTHEAMSDQPQTTAASPSPQLARYSARLDQAEPADLLGILAELSTGDGTHTLSGTTADMYAHADAIDWDIYEEPGEPARFRMRDAKHI